MSKETRGLWPVLAPPGSFLARLEAAFQEQFLDVRKKQSAYDGEVQPSDGPNPDRGIVCPWNKGDDGPCGRRVVCHVWKNLDDFDEWGSEGNHYFCRVLCQHGRNPEQANRARQMRDRLVRTPAWMKALGPPAMYRLPPRVRKGP